MDLDVTITHKSGVDVVKQMRTSLYLLWYRMPHGVEYRNSFRSKHLKHDRMLTDLPVYKTMQQNVDSRSLSVTVGQSTSWHLLSNRPLDTVAERSKSTDQR